MPDITFCEINDFGRVRSGLGPRNVCLINRRAVISVWWTWNAHAFVFQRRYSKLHSVLCAAVSCKSRITFSCAFFLSLKVYECRPGTATATSTSASCNEMRKARKKGEKKKTEKPRKSSRVNKFGSRE